MLHTVVHTILLTGAVLGMFFSARFAERKWPIGPNMPDPEVMSDWFVVFVNMLLSLPFGWLTVPCSVLIIRGLGGGGLIYVPTEGWWYVPALLGFIVVYDLYRYILHRLQHVVPWLWSMHSFHHSANAITLVTGARHLWLEKAVMEAFFPLFPILFTVPADMATAMIIVYLLPDGCAHLNVKFPMGRAITWINNPQWHRIHHSVQPEHFDKNFASLLPVWDIIFGTAWIPQPDEYPATGLVPNESVGIIDSIIWPFRHFLRRRVSLLRAHNPVAPAE